MKILSTISLVFAAVTIFADVECPRILAHRGGRAEYDENVVGAFSKSLSAGVTGFETDLRLTADDQIVISHDATSDRITTTPGVEIESSTLAECTALKLKRSGENVPTLVQIVELFRGREDVFVEFELKSSPPDPARLELYCRKAYETITAVMDKRNFAFTSFKQEVLLEMRRLYPDVTLSYIAKNISDADLDFAKSNKIDRIAPSFKSDPEQIKKAHEMGLGITMWMVETEAAWKIARDMGATAATSDHPIRLLKEISSSSEE